jgi:hypothetical protein
VPPSTPFLSVILFFTQLDDHLQVQSFTPHWCSCNIRVSRERGRGRANRSAAYNAYSRSVLYDAKSDTSRGYAAVL